MIVALLFVMLVGVSFILGFFAGLNMFGKGFVVIKYQGKQIWPLAKT